jgi:hypothetical protein
MWSAKVVTNQLTSIYHTVSNADHSKIQSPYLTIYRRAITKFNVSICPSPWKGEGVRKAFLQGAIGAVINTRENIVHRFDFFQPTTIDFALF